MPLRILLVHTYYQQPGGERLSFEAEARLLAQHGHDVHLYTAHNEVLDTMSAMQKAHATLWNRDAQRALFKTARTFQADVVHFNNTFPLLSPAVYYGARAAGAAVVQTLRNYRLLCANALFYREGQPCEECLGRTPPWPGVLHACYRNSHIASAGVAAMLTLHRFLKTWHEQVDRFVVLTPFARRKFVEGGLAEAKLSIKPNFLDTDPRRVGVHQAPHSMVYVGRYSAEKGLGTLLSAWKDFTIPITLVGKGPLTSTIDAATQHRPYVRNKGFLGQQEVFDVLRSAYALIFPSQWYEGMPRVILEAFAMGVPVIASDLGAMSSLVDHGRTGLHVRPGDADDLAVKVRWLWDHPEERAAMGRAARAEYEAKYTAERNYDLLMQIYADALRHRHAAS